MDFSGYTGLLAALSYGSFALALPWRGKHSLPNAALTAAAASTALWAATQAAGLQGSTAAGFAAALRDAAWLGTLLFLLRAETGSSRLWYQLAAITFLVAAANLYFAFTGVVIDTGTGVALSPPLLRFASTVTGLILCENLYRNAGRAGLWSIKLLLAGLASLYAYHLIAGIPPLLGRDPIADYGEAGPILYLICLPLFVVTAIRGEKLRLKLHSSRDIVFHSATLIITGIILQGAAAAALYLRHFGGTPATVLSLVFGFSALVALLVCLSAQSMRSRLRSFINENFFSYKYDYRQEWTKFNLALTRYEDHTGPERALLTLSDLLDSPGGVLFVRRNGWRQFARLAYSAFGESLGAIQDSDPLLAGLNGPAQAFLLVSEHPDWRDRFAQAWLVIPLYHRGTLTGFCLLHKPRAPKKLDWEDRTLVGLIATQLAAMLVQEQTAQALADSQQLAEFNNRVAFALHDLKNTAGQLALMAQNASRFGDNAAFRADMLQTVRHAAENLNKLIAKLRDGSAPEPACALVNIEQLVARAARKWRSSDVAFSPSGPHFSALANGANFEAALEHVLANAVEASPEPGSVRISLSREGGKIVVSVEDRGPGMSAEFIANDLFRPLVTTKAKGLGIGAYQARALMHDLKGEIEVASTPGKGTTIRLILPAGDIAVMKATA